MEPLHSFSFRSISSITPPSMIIPYENGIILYSPIRAVKINILNMDRLPHEKIETRSAAPARPRSCYGGGCRGRIRPTVSPGAPPIPLGYGFCRGSEEAIGAELASPGGAGPPRIRAFFSKASLLVKLAPCLHPVQVIARLGRNLIVKLGIKFFCLHVVGIQAL